MCAQAVGDFAPTSALFCEAEAYTGPSNFPRACTGRTSRPSLRKLTQLWVRVTYSVHEHTESVVKHLVTQKLSMDYRCSASNPSGQSLVEWLLT